MAKTKITHLEQKKQQLKQELHEIEDALDKSIGKVKEEVSTTINPKRLIREYPLPAFAASVAIGMLLGRDRKKNLTYQEEKAKERKKSVVASEIKYAVTRKAIHLLLDFMDKKIAQMKQNSQSRH